MPRKAFSPDIADFGCRVPLTPHLRAALLLYSIFLFKATVFAWVFRALFVFIKEVFVKAARKTGESVDKCFGKGYNEWVKGEIEYE